MKKIILICTILVNGFLFSNAAQNDLKIFLKNNMIKQGHSFSIFISSYNNKIKFAKAYYKNRMFNFFEIYKKKIWRLIIGVDVAENPGRKQILLFIKLKNGKTIKRYQTIKILPFVFRQRTTDGRRYTPRVVYNKRMLKILRQRKKLKLERIYISRILSKISRYQFWKGNFIYPTTWLKYRTIIKNGRKLKVPREKPTFGMKRINITRRGKRIRYHRGTDYSNVSWTNVYAVNSGKILTARFFPARGGTIIIDHGQGVLSVYCHLLRLKVREGYIVKKGKIIGKIGSTGLSTGSHLHFEIRINGVSVTPKQWFNYKFFIPVFY